MTDTNTRQAAPTTGRRRPSLYRTVLSLAVAALVAAWLPFSALYVTAVNSRPTPTVLSTPQSSTGATRVITTTSGATQVVRAPGSAAATIAAAPTPVVTRVS